MYMYIVILAGLSHQLVKILHLVYTVDLDRKILSSHLMKVNLKETICHITTSCIEGAL